METDLAYCVYLIWQCSVVFTLLSQCSSTIGSSLVPRPIRKIFRGYIVSFPVYCSHCCWDSEMRLTCVTWVLNLGICHSVSNSRVVTPISTDGGQIDWSVLTEFKTIGLVLKFYSAGWCSNPTASLMEFKSDWMELILLVCSDGAQF